MITVDVGENIVKKIILSVTIMFIISTLQGCNTSSYKPSSDEIALNIKLNTKEDIGLLVIDYDTNDTHSSGGTSNADKTLLKHDETIIYTLSKNEFNDPKDVSDLSLTFTVITEYCTPNYDNIYPTEYTKPMDAISINGEFGKSYNITISGDKNNGYQATVDEWRIL